MLEAVLASRINGVTTTHPFCCNCTYTNLKSVRGDSRSVAATEEARAGGTGDLYTCTWITQNGCTTAVQISVAVTYDALRLGFNSGSKNNTHAAHDSVHLTTTFSVQLCCDPRAEQQVRIHRVVRAGDDGQ